MAPPPPPPPHDYASGGYYQQPGGASSSSNKQRDSGGYISAAAMRENAAAAAASRTSNSRAVAAYGGSSRKAPGAGTGAVTTIASAYVDTATTIASSSHASGRRSLFQVKETEHPPATSNATTSAASQYLDGGGGAANSAGARSGGAAAGGTTRQSRSSNRVKGERRFRDNLSMLLASGVAKTFGSSSPDSVAASNRKSALRGEKADDSGALSGGCSVQPYVDELRRHFALRAPQLSHFHLDKTVGTGTFGRVRLVRLRFGPSTPMALKILKKSWVLEMKQIEHVKSEKAILESISHPFIVNLLSTFQDRQRVYMLMEYVPGGELFSHLRNRQQLPAADARFYAAEIVLAFEYLHGLRVVYRDLKPENILLDIRGHVKLTDFGFAKVVEDRTWTLCGTPEYLAPEVIQSRGHGKSVDWWALGVLIYEMIVGHPPFYDDEPMKIYRKVIKGSIEYPPCVDDKAKDLIRKLLAHDRTKRYGCLKAGAEDVKTHKFFASISWTDCYNRNLKAPYVPKISGLDDTSLFDNYEDSNGEDNPLSDSENLLFADF